MPELPEVETIRRDLEAAVLGRTIRVVSLFAPETVKTPSPGDFVAHLPGKQILAVARRAKYLILRLSGGDSWILHLMLEGQFRDLPAAAPIDPLTKLVVELDDGAQLRLRDLAGFARTFLLPTEAESSFFATLGPEPLAADFDCERFLELLEGHKGMIKPLLLDQRVAAGVGNLYADEALFRARIHPQRKLSTLSREERCRLHDALVEVLREGVEHRGTSARNGFYRDLWGNKGHHQDFLRVFRREGEACPHCGGTVEKIRVGGRATFVCPACQLLTR